MTEQDDSTSRNPARKVCLDLGTDMRETGRFTELPRRNEGGRAWSIPTSRA